MNECTYSAWTYPAMGTLKSMNLDGICLGNGKPRDFWLCQLLSLVGPGRDVGAEVAAWAGALLGFGNSGEQG